MRAKVEIKQMLVEFVSLSECHYVYEAESKRYISCIAGLSNESLLASIITHQ